MVKHTLVGYGNERADVARRALTTEQIIFAEWLAVPTSERIPPTQNDLAQQLSVSKQSITYWKQIPEIWTVRDSIITHQAKEMVVDAIKVMKDKLNSNSDKIALDAARDILDRWAEPRRHASIVATIKELYDQYHTDKR